MNLIGYEVGTFFGFRFFIMALTFFDSERPCRDIQDGGSNDIKKQLIFSSFPLV